MISNKDGIIWRLLKDRRYKITRDGRVWTKLRKGCSKSLGKSWREIGRVSTSRGGRKNYVRVKYQGQEFYRNRAVYARFAGQLDSNKVVHHKDHDRLNDKFSNLRQATTSENLKEGWAYRRYRGPSNGIEVKARYLNGASGGKPKFGGKHK